MMYVIPYSLSFHKFVSLEEVEQSTGVPGKYTVGLNQHRLGFADDREDINSIALSSNLSCLALCNLY